MSITLQRLSYKRIGEIADQFLSKYHSSLSLPIPIEDLSNLATKITDEEYGWLEYQAYSFASHILVPTQPLLNELKKRLGRIPSQEAPEILTTVIEDLLEVFQVSGDVLVRRLVKEAIVKPNS